MNKILNGLACFVLLAAGAAGANAQHEGLDNKALERMLIPGEPVTGTGVVIAREKRALGKADRYRPNNWKRQPRRKPGPQPEPRPQPVSHGSVDHKIGQMIMVGFRGKNPGDPGVRAVLSQIRKGQIGGVMLMGHNISSISQIARLTRAMYASARAGGQMIPLISIDQEGGRVQRLKVTRYPSAKQMSRQGLKRARGHYSQMACQLRSAGLNVNFGPVVDVDVTGRSNPIIGRYGRSYSGNPQTVAAYAGTFVAAHKQFGVMTTAKHFPGHGSSLRDSHKGFTAIPGWNRAKDELLPYRKLARRVDMVMVGHLFHKRWGAPASLSHAAISGMLRREVGFRGVVITDDMEMGAIRKHYKRNNAVIRAVNAGNDILLYSNTWRHSPNLGRHLGATIRKALCGSRGEKAANCIPSRVIENAYRRIARMKSDRARAAAFSRAPRRCHFNVLAELD